MAINDNSRADALTEDLRGKLTRHFEDIAGLVSFEGGPTKRDLQTILHVVREARKLLAAPVEQHEAAPAGYCERAGGCVCGGDLPRVREGCSEWVRPARSAPLEDTGNGADERAANPIGYIRDLIANDAYAMSFQTMGKYRTALLAALNAPGTEVAGAAPATVRGALVADAQRYRAFRLLATEPDAATRERMMSAMERVIEGLIPQDRVEMLQAAELDALIDAAIAAAGEARNG